MTVWLVWYGEYEPVLMDLYAKEADARKAAHELRKQYGWDAHVFVEEREVK